MDKIHLLNLVKELRNNKDIEFVDFANKIDAYALQMHQSLCDIRLNKNNESIELLSIKKYPNEQTQRDAYSKGYSDALNFKFEDMTVLIDWVKRLKSRNYLEQECPYQIVSDYHHALRKDYFK